MLRRLLMPMLCLMVGCGQKMETPTADDKAKAAEVEKMTKRREMSALYEQWKAKRQDFQFELDQSLRWQFDLPDSAKRSQERAHEIGKDIDRLDQQSREKYGVSCELLPGLLDH